MEPGSPSPPGATPDADGTNFSVYSGAADSVELCLFDADGQSERRMPFADCSDGRWHGYVPGCAPGQLYGFRVHGRYAPSEGLRCNPAKLLIDPFARALSGAFRWNPAVFDYVGRGHRLEMNRQDSAPYVPKSVVTEALPPPPEGPKIRWTDTIVYEANVRGYTMRHPAVPETDRGRFAGMHNGAVLEYLKALGITSVELMPVHEFIDERFLVDRGLRNYWGYNPIGFFAAASRYAHSDPRGEFIEMVNAIHDAGMEVVLDVVYNHTGESDRLGPTLSFRGLDNQAYYRLEPGEPDRYVDDTGCGNTVNFDHHEVRELVLSSLVYWSQAMGVDGFRFDLATILGRSEAGFSRTHDMLEAIAAEPALAGVKLIAEPWDPGPAGYQLGHFPRGWAEWNDAYRDTVRRFWRGDDDQAGAFARRIHGSADLFEGSGRMPAASINLVTSHDGFTLADVVSYERRHNEANGEGNRDGHKHNCSGNYGVEGPTDDDDILSTRRRQRLNMLATLLLSQGTPMILAGDELGNSQAGNNNAYAQDNETGWIDWSGLEQDKDFLEQVRSLIRLRRDCSQFRATAYRHGLHRGRFGWRDIEWFDASGKRPGGDAWHKLHALTLLLSDEDGAAAVLFNASDEAVEFTLPEGEVPATWRTAFRSATDAEEIRDDARRVLPGKSIACLLAD